MYTNDYRFTVLAAALVSNAKLQTVTPANSSLEFKGQGQQGDHVLHFKNATFLLNEFLRDYDRRLRPAFGGYTRSSLL